MARPKLATPDFKLRLRGPVWTIFYTYGGKTLKHSTGTADRTEAEEAKRRFMLKFLADPPPLTGAAVDADPTVGKIIAAYLEEHIPTTRSQTTNRDALRPINDLLGALKPVDLSEDVMKRYAARRGQAHRWGRVGAGTIAPGTIAREVNALRGALGWAVRKRLIPEKITLSTPVKLPQGKMRFLSKEEVAALISEVPQIRVRAPNGDPKAPIARRFPASPGQQQLDATYGVPHIRLFIRLALATAARKAAILGLKWSNVDLSHASVKQVGVDHEGEPVYRMDGHITIDLGAGHGNKRRPSFMITKNPNLYRDLVLARNRALSEHVIEFRGRPVDDIKRAFEHARKGAGLGNDVTPHTLKHTAVSWLVGSGMTFSEIAVLTNTSEVTLANVYGHLSPVIARRAGGVLAI